MTCLFCKLARKELSASYVFENETLIAFRDTNPQAPTHILIIPKKHIETVNHVEDDDAALLGQMIITAKQLASAEGYSESGYRLVMNTHADAGQTVFHIHLHLLAGRQLTWPPG